MDDAGSLVVVDLENLAKSLFRMGILVSKIRHDILMNSVAPEPKEVYYFLPAEWEQDAGKLPLIRALRNFYGFHLVAVPMDDNGPKNRVDRSIISQLPELAREYQAIFIFSGDGGFIPVINELRSVGKKVVVVSRWQDSHNGYQEGPFLELSAVITPDMVMSD